MTLPIEQLIPDREQAEGLIRAGILSNDDFWAAMATDPAFLSRVFPEPVPRASVLSAMTREGVEEAKAIAFPLAARIIPDLVVIAILSLLLYGFARDRGSRTPNRSLQVVITAKEGLAPFHVISSRDVSLQMRPLASDSATSLEDVIGRYSAQFLSEDTVILRRTLSRGPKLPESPPRKVFQLTIRPTALLIGTAAPLRINLLAAPRVTTAKGRVFEDIFLLSTSPGTDGNIAVVAAPSDDAPDLASLLGISDFIVALPGG